LLPGKKLLLLLESKNLFPNSSGVMLFPLVFVTIAWIKLKLGRPVIPVAWEAPYKVESMTTEPGTP